MDRALRRYRRELVRLRWLRRIKRRRAWRGDSSVQVLAAARRVKNHFNLRNHSRKSCSYCNPMRWIGLRERVLRRDFSAELTVLVVK